MNRRAWLPGQVAVQRRLPAVSLFIHHRHRQEMGGRRNQHWLVNSGKTELVLHASPIDISYELQVQQYLRREGWPVPQLIRTIAGGVA